MLASRIILAVTVGIGIPCLITYYFNLFFILQLGFDVFNALDLMDNIQFLKPLKFGIGDGNLQYYLYNWKAPSIDPQNIGLVLQ